jgi:hypothetical protein
MTTAALFNRLQQDNLDRPLPHQWTQHPDLAHYTTIGDLYAVLISRIRWEDSDRAIRALVSLPADAPDHRTLLIMAVTRHTHRQSYQQHLDRDDVASEVAAMICGPLNFTDTHLAERYASRAIQRVLWRTKKAGRVLLHTDNSSSYVDTRPSTEQVAVDRAAISSFNDAVQRERAAGRISNAQWANYVAGILAPALGQPSGRRIVHARQRNAFAGIVAKNFAVEPHSSL